MTTLFSHLSPDLARVEYLFLSRRPISGELVIVERISLSLSIEYPITAVVYGQDGRVLALGISEHNPGHLGIGKASPPAITSETFDDCFLSVDQQRQFRAQ